MADAETAVIIARDNFENRIVKKETQEGSNQSPFVCGYCQRQFDRISPFCLHIKGHNQAADDSFHICDYFESDKNFAYGCKKCQMEFPSICLLHSHLLVCSGSYVYDHEQSIAFPIDDLYMKGRSDEVNEGEVRTESSETVDKITDKIENIVNNVALESGKSPAEADPNLQEIQVGILTESRNETVDKAPVQGKRKRGRPRKSEANQKETENKKRKPRVKKSSSKRDKKIVNEEDVGGDSNEISSNGRICNVVKEEEDVEVEVMEDSEQFDASGMETMYKEKNDVTLSDGKRTSAQKRKRTIIKPTGKRKPRRNRSCEICGKVFSEKSSLKVHMYGHSDNKNFKCEYCPAAFKYPANLTSHLRTHPVPPKGKRKPGSKCELCGKLCQDVSKLRMHMFSHSEDRNFVCEICSTSYKYPNHLQVHMKTHKEVKPFYCDLCGEGFIVADR